MSRLQCAQVSSSTYIGNSLLQNPMLPSVFDVVAREIKMKYAGLKVRAPFYPLSPAGFIRVQVSADSLFEEEKSSVFSLQYLV